MTNPTIDPVRLERAMSATLLKGAHDKPNGEFQACVMEAVAFVAGEPWSDHPKCASPVIGAFMRVWNDGLNEDDRNRLLKPLIVKLVGTRGSKALENRRATMAADWFIRVQTPAWLRLAKLDKHADLLASMPEITDFSKAPSLMPALTAERTDAYAAWAAAVDAAGDALRPTVEALQASALELVERMIAEPEPKQ